MNVFISGISRGLGLELANEYASQGHTVLGVSRTAPVDANPGITHLNGDVTDPSCEARIYDKISTLASLDIVINNAGCGSRGSRLEAVKVDKLSSQIALHCTGALMVTKATLHKLRCANNPKIVNVTSRLGSIARHVRGDFRGMEFSYCYRIAKCAQNMLTECMQGDWSLNGIIVAAINPGLLLTESGSQDAKYTAREGATAFIQKVKSINISGYYHAFDEDATL